MLDKDETLAAAFVSYSVHQVAVDTTSTVKPSAGALRLHFKNPGLALETPDDCTIGVIDHGQGKGHAFFIESVDEDGNCKTIEGNTDPDGEREATWWRSVPAEPRTSHTS